jgi:cytochrome c6
MHETLFFICGGILAVSAIVVSLFGLKNDNFPGKWMPLIIVWFAVFAVGAGTFAVLHGKDESKDHDKEYAKASEEIAKADSTGPFVEAEEEAREAETGESSEGAEGEGLVEGEQAQEEKKFEPGGEGEAGEGEAPGGGGNAELGAAVFGENCSTCHGATGHGGNGGPDLTTQPKAKTLNGAVEQVTEGGGGMPAFAELLSTKEIEDVAAYVVESINGK